MGKRQLLMFLVPVSVSLLTICFFAFGNGVALLDPKGIIAEQERELIKIGAILALTIITPVLLVLFYTVYKYSDNKNKYTPEKKSSPKVQLIWWAIPSLFIFTLAIITWQKTHILDPYKPILSKNSPIKVQVVSLRWKWLFIYPEQNIAMINFLEFPVKTPVNFELTADSPMNSFWIPNLGGQIYSMTGMSTKTHLLSEKIGTYEGSSAEISGSGFSGMRFEAKSTTSEDFYSFVKFVQSNGKDLDYTKFESLSKPSENNEVTYFRLKDKDLYNKIVSKYIKPISNNE